MELKVLLAFVVTLWAVHIAVLLKAFGTPPNIKRNMLKSWTGSKLPIEYKDIRDNKYIVFDLENYKKVPWILRWIRIEYLSYKCILIIGLFSFLVFIGLGLFTAYITFQTIGSVQTKIPDEPAQVLIAGHIIIFFLNIGLISFYRYFESRFAHHIYIIDENG